MPQNQNINQNWSSKMTSIKNVKVKPLTSVRSGRPVPNQNIITLNSVDGVYQYFQSYNSIIVCITPNGSIHLSDHWDFSTTTSKYRNAFLNMTTQEVKKGINNGAIVVDMDHRTGELLSGGGSVMMYFQFITSHHNYGLRKVKYFVKGELLTMTEANCHNLNISLLLKTGVIRVIQLSKNKTHKAALCADIRFPDTDSGYILTEDLTQ